MKRIFFYFERLWDQSSHLIYKKDIEVETLPIGTVFRTTGGLSGTITGYHYDEGDAALAMHVRAEKILLHPNEIAKVGKTMEDAGYNIT